MTTNYNTIYLLYFDVIKDKKSAYGNYNTLENNINSKFNQGILAASAENNNTYSLAGTISEKNLASKLFNGKGYI